MTKIIVNDIELYYERYGSGMPFLVMHGGLGMDHSYFRPALDPLGDICEFYFFDFRGHGRSGRPPLDTITFEQLADDTDALREHLGHEKIGIIGHSAGGWVALHYALRHPEHISHLILLDTSPAMDYGEEIMEIVVGKKPTPEILEALNAPAATSPEEFIEQFKILLPIYFYDFNLDIQEKAKHGIENMIVTPEVNQHQDTLLEKYNLSSHLKEIQTSTLILVGDADFICPPSQAKRMHEGIPNSEIHIFEKCGHFPFWESPEEFISVMRNWLNKKEN